MADYPRSAVRLHAHEAMYRTRFVILLRFESLELGKDPRDVHSAGFRRARLMIII